MTKISAPPIQQKIDIDDIQDGFIRLKNGSWRAILLTTSINFSLKSTEEQEALIYRYQAFLNSLDFSIQILAVSQRLDISPYLSLLEQKRKEQENELLRIQISEYTDFIKSLTQMTNIMTQSFFVIIPLAPVEQKETTFIQKISGALRPQNKNKNETTKSDSELKIQLQQRVNYIMSSLISIGLKATPLNTEEITELFYSLYNRGSREKQSSATKQ